MAKLADRYREMMALRGEGLRRYRANEFSTISGPPCNLSLPRIELSKHAGLAPKIALGPFSIFDRPPLWAFAERALRRFDRRVRVLEIGPGSGVLATYLQGLLGDRIESYFALERDPSFTGPYERVSRLEEIKIPVDVIIASEVAEHMSSDDWYECIVLPIKEIASPDASLIMSVPNPTSPGGIARDFTHAQNYPWYDLYALMRLEFADVDIHRAYYAWSAQRLAFLLPRILICHLIELDWCDTLICTASRIYK